MNTLTKTMSTSTKNMVAMAEHTLGAMIGIFIILGQFNKSFDKDLWLYMVIFLPIFTGNFVFKSEDEKRRVGRKAAIISIIATIASIAFYAAFKGIWILNAHSWYFFLGTSVASLNLAMIILFIRSRRQ